MAPATDVSLHGREQSRHVEPGLGGPRFAPFLNANDPPRA